MSDSVNKSNDLTYQKNDKFYGLKVPSNCVKILEMHKYKKPFIKVGFTDCKIKDTLILVNWDKIGMLADFVGINRNEMHKMVSSNDRRMIQTINDKLMAQGERIIQINCSSFQNQWYIYAISTESHVIIPFNKIKEVVKSKWVDIVESDYNNSKVYEKTFRSIETTVDKFDVLLRCTSGRNIKTCAIKVVVLLRVKSCMNSVIAAEFESVKHTENWKERLEKHLVAAITFAHSVQSIINIGINRVLSLENGIKYIKAQTFGLKDVSKIQTLQNLVIDRFQFEYESHKNAWSLSQALSYVGTHSENVEEASEHALEMMQTKAYSVLSTPNETVFF